MAILFRRTKELEGMIDQFLDHVVEGSLLFRQGVLYYLDDDLEALERCMHELGLLENAGDALRRDVETRMYSETLIPEARGDVLGLLETIDEVLNATHKTLDRFHIEKPVFPVSIHKKFKELIEVTASANDSMIAAVRAYFREPSRVRDHITRTRFYEHEADRLAESIKRVAFDGDELDLAQKMHVSVFTCAVEAISDEAEDVADRLAIAVIKRYD